MHYTVTEPTREKIESLLDLCAAHAAFEASDYKREKKAERLAIDLFGENRKLYCLVVEADGYYIGYITWMKQYSTWDAKAYLYMDCLYLDDQYRGFGIGAELINHLKAFGRKEGIDLIQWQTPKFNVRAIKFYKRIGARNKSKERFFLDVENKF
jgi:GNAT superfamily N-acetyltransferase